MMYRHPAGSSVNRNAPISHFHDPGRTQFDAYFRQGHERGREHGQVGRFDQYLAAGDPERPGLGEGYKAGHRLAKIERERRYGR